METLNMVSCVVVPSNFVEVVEGSPFEAVDTRKWEINPHSGRGNFKYDPTMYVDRCWGFECNRYNSMANRARHQLSMPTFGEGWVAEVVQDFEGDTFPPHVMWKGTVEGFEAEAHPKCPYDSDYAAYIQIKVRAVVISLNYENAFEWTPVGEEWVDSVIFVQANDRAKPFAQRVGLQPLQNVLSVAPDVMWELRRQNTVKDVLEILKSL